MMIAGNGQESIQTIESQIMAYYRFIRSFNQLNERQIEMITKMFVNWSLLCNFRLLESKEQCLRRDYEEMKNLLLKNPTSKENSPADSFSLEALQNFYVLRR
jgi:hypothetical protein